VSRKSPNPASRPASRPGCGASPLLPLAGRQRELRRLQALLASGNRVLVLGPRGIGKSRLIAEAAAASGIEPVRVSTQGPPQELFRQLLPLLCPETDSPVSVRRLPSQALQARILAALQSRPRWIWLDDPPPASALLYRFFQRVLWIPRCGLIAAVENRARLGALARLLYDPREEILLAPLSHADSAALLERAIHAFGLGLHDSPAEFRLRTLEAAAGNPGRIITLCRLAADPQYWHGGRLMFAPLWIDALTRLA
jgi:energy-coupling factor transporter ATP-binding protein EcfA2